MKEQDNFPEVLDEKEVSNLLIELRVMIMRLLILTKKGIETVKKKDHSEIKNAISDINNTLEETNCTLEEAEDWISVLEDKVEKNTQSEQQKEKRILKKSGDNMKPSIYIMGIPEGKESEQGIENLLE